MTRLLRAHPISAAAWPTLAVGSVILVLLATAAPVIVHLALSGRVSPKVDLWATVLTGVGATIVLAIGWVLVRQRREQRMRRREGNAEPPQPTPPQHIE